MYTVLDKISDGLYVKTTDRNDVKQWRALGAEAAKINRTNGKLPSVQWPAVYRRLFNEYAACYHGPEVNIRGMNPTGPAAARLTAVMPNNDKGLGAIEREPQAGQWKCEGRSDNGEVCGAINWELLFPGSADRRKRCYKCKWKRMMTGEQQPDTAHGALDEQTPAQAQKPGSGITLTDEQFQALMAAMAPKPDDTAPNTSDRQQELTVMAVDAGNDLMLLATTQPIQPMHLPQPYPFDGILIKQPDSDAENEHAPPKRSMHKANVLMDVAATVSVIWIALTMLSWLVCNAGNAASQVVMTLTAPVQMQAKAEGRQRERVVYWYSCSNHYVRRRFCLVAK